MTDLDATDARSWSVSTVCAANRAAMPTATEAFWANRSAKRVSAVPKKPARASGQLAEVTVGKET